MTVHFYGSKRPSKVSAMGTVFCVKWFEEMESMGEIDFHTCTIRINKDLTPQLAVDTLIHELIHAVWFFASVGKKAKEEKAVSVIASGLNSIFAANEGLADWIEEVHHDK